MHSEDWLVMNRSYDNAAKSPKVKYSAAYFTGRELVFNAEAQGRRVRRDVLGQ